eukprot:scaffold5653_cov147-Cylindrotheca_fusiformis.AAC.18
MLSLVSAAGRSSLRRQWQQHQRGQVVVRCFSDVGGPKQAVRKVKKKPKKSREGEEGRPKDLQIILASLDAERTRAPPPVDEEEIARREEVLKQYTIGKFQQHNEENHDLSCKLKLKKHAMNMLPPELKEKALEIDNEGPPRWRTIPAWTPPIPGFDPRDFMNTEE